MKRRIAGASLLLFLISCLSGCGAVGAKSASITVVYAATAVLSLMVLVGYCCAMRKKYGWFVLLFSSVFVVNIGYFCLSISSSLDAALFANRIAYLGSVMLPLAMLMNILQVTRTRYPKWLPWCLVGLSIVILFIAGSPGYLDIYYKEVSFAVINGVATLIKVYGPLHPLYLFYLLGYFAVMIAVIIYARAKKTIATFAHAIVMAIAVFVNIGVWFIEQLVTIDFEMLSISYIISELFLLGIHLVINEHQRLEESVQQTANDQVSPLTQEIEEQPLVEETTTEDAAASFLRGYDTLTPRERELFDAYTQGKTTKDIMAMLGIKENTLKYHNRNLYSKMGVSSRKQLIAVYRELCEAGTVIGETDTHSDS